MSRRHRSASESRDLYQDIKISSLIEIPAYLLPLTRPNVLETFPSKSSPDNENDAQHKEANTANSPQTIANFRPSKKKIYSSRSHLVRLRDHLPKQIKTKQAKCARTPTEPTSNVCTATGSVSSSAGIMSSALRVGCRVGICRMCPGGVRLA